MVLMAWTIYALKCPYSGEVRYVGYTGNRKPEKRLAAHLTEARRMENQSRKHRWIRSVLAKGSEPVLTVLETGEHGRWQEAEIRWIAFYRERGAMLVNSAEGGGRIAIPDVRTTEDRREAAKRGIAAMTPAKRRAHIENAARGWFSKTTEERRSEIRRIVLAALTDEVRANGGRKGGTKTWADRTPEQRTLFATLASRGLSTEERRANMEKVNASVTHEQRAQWRLKNFDRCHDRAIRMNNMLTPEQRRDNARRGVITRRKRQLEKLRAA